MDYMGVCKMRLLRSGASDASRTVRVGLNARDSLG